MFGFWKRRRRRALIEQGLAPEWVDRLAREVSLCGRLAEEERRRLHGHIAVFLSEKRFEGCGGFGVTDAVRTVVAGHACLLQLGFTEPEYYPDLTSILMYADDFVAPVEEVDESGLVIESEDVHVGESWEVGALVLSWREIERDRRAHDGRNVVLHEFAHQLDPNVAGWPAHVAGAGRRACAEVFEREYNQLVRAVDRGERTFIDPYGAEDPSEFFAVISEALFEQPRRLRLRAPALYEALVQFYGQDTAARGENNAPAEKGTR